MNPEKPISLKPLTVAQAMRAAFQVDPTDAPKTPKSAKRTMAKKRGPKKGK